METRKSYLPTKFETREADNKRYIEGYFIVFNKRTELWDGFFEQVDPDSIKNLDNVKALYNHNHDIVLGSTKNSTLKLEKDSIGIKGIIEVNEKDQDAVNAYERIKRGDVPGCSFGFFIRDENVEELENGEYLATLMDIELFEVSPCVFPQYEQTFISARKKQAKEACSRAYQAKIQGLIKRIGG